MNNKIQELGIRTITAVVMATIFFAAYSYAAFTFNLFLLLTLAWILVVEWPKLCPLKGAAGLVCTLAYPITPMLMLLHLHHYARPLNFWMPLYPFLIAMSYDTVAYLAGTWFGKHKICPQISPKKSWEGLFAGFLAVFVVVTLITNKKLTFIGLCNCSLWIKTTILTLAAFGGDLFESWLKRLGNVKDAANLLPGHGGILDRIDAVLGVMIVFWLFW